MDMGQNQAKWPQLPVQEEHPPPPPEMSFPMQEEERLQPFAPIQQRQHQQQLQQQQPLPFSPTPHRRQPIVHAQLAQPKRQQLQPEHSIPALPQQPLPSPISFQQQHFPIVDPQQRQEQQLLQLPSSANKGVRSLVDPFPRFQQQQLQRLQHPRLSRRRHRRPHHLSLSEGKSGRRGV